MTSKEIYKEPEEYFQPENEAKKNVLEFKIGGLEELVEGLRSRIDGIQNDNLRIPLERQLESNIDKLRKLKEELDQFEKQVEEAENNNAIH